MAKTKHLILPTLLLHTTLITSLWASGSDGIDLDPTDTAPVPSVQVTAPASDADIAPFSDLTEPPAPVKSAEQEAQGVLNEFFASLSITSALPDSGDEIAVTPQYRFQETKGVEIPIGNLTYTSAAALEALVTQNPLLQFSDLVLTAGDASALPNGTVPYVFVNSNMPLRVTGELVSGGSIVVVWPEGSDLSGLKGRNVSNFLANQIRDHQNYKPTHNAIKEALAVLRVLEAGSESDEFDDLLATIRTRTADLRTAAKQHKVDDVIAQIKSTKRWFLASDATAELTQAIVAESPLFFVARTDAELQQLKAEFPHIFAYTVSIVDPRFRRGGIYFNTAGAAQWQPNLVFKSSEPVMVLMPNDIGAHVTVQDGTLWLLESGDFSRKPKIDARDAKRTTLFGALTSGNLSQDMARQLVEFAQSQIKVKAEPTAEPTA